LFLSPAFSVGTYFLSFSWRSPVGLLGFIPISIMGLTRGDLPAAFSDSFPISIVGLTRSLFTVLLVRFFGSLKKHLFIVVARRSTFNDHCGGFVLCYLELEILWSLCSVLLQHPAVLFLVAWRRTESTN
jgi:hypothetical protein